MNDRNNLVGLHAQPKTRQATCETHGDFESKCFIGTVWSKCPVCSKEAEEREQANRQKAEAEARLAAWQKRIGQSGIPERFHDRSLDNFIATTDPQRKALAFAQVYAEEFDQVLAAGRSALFVGKPGTGKTHLAAAIGLQIMRKQSRAVLFTTVMRAVRRVKDSWHRDSIETESQAVSALVFPDLLILDEVGVQFGSEFEKNIIFDVLNERYEKRRPTILLSNLAVADVTAYLGERVLDRIREDGGARIVFDWESYRGKMSAARCR